MTPNPSLSNKLTEVSLEKHRKDQKRILLDPFIRGELASHSLPQGMLLWPNLCAEAALAGQISQDLRSLCLSNYRAAQGTINAQ